MDMAAGAEDDAHTYVSWRGGGAGQLDAAPPGLRCAGGRQLPRPLVKSDASRGREPEPEGTPKEFVSGETFLYLGRQHRLDVRRGDDVAPLQLRGGRLRVAVPPAVPKQHTAGYVRAALIDWYRARARALVGPGLRDFAARLGAESVDVVVADQAKRWGSCSQGVVRINWRVVQAPKTLIEYVLAHEAVHLVHEHHGPVFWATLGRLLPDYEARRARLREVGVALLW